MTGRRTGPGESIPLIRLPRFADRATVAPDAARPGATPTPAAGGATHADPVKVRQIKAVLAGSNIGAAAVKYLDAHRLPIRFQSGQGSGWDGDKILLDDDTSVQEAALALVHEVHHARAASNEKTRADILKDTRADFVRKMLDEETSAKIDTIKTSNELAAQGMTLERPVHLAAEFNNAFLRGMGELQRLKPDASTAELAAAGERAGRAVVLKQFTEGGVTTSNTRERYPAYYERLWDDRHPTKSQPKP